ncbi:hypothetical protein QYE76_009662 [Lolium multiflorum]|uniref:DUF4283 domain-containing protein n=1 Tax=Lolium multiflorum TaxID=4521 RepID=A0AAD8TSB6_LOLMU|nr:hypothetical protein QYE76_009662 [Lolium multiflorum]
MVLLKEYSGSVRPSDMVFDTVEIWVRVLDLPMDMMNLFFAKLIGGWIGKYIAADVDEEGMAWGKDLRIRVQVRVDQPLLRGVSVKESEKEVEGIWYDLKYEKIPHFCFDCGCLVHPEDCCPAEKQEVKQWGEWLRASPGRNLKAPAPPRPTVSSGSYGSRSTESESRGRGMASVRNIPPRRNLSRDYDYFDYSSSSHTGGNEQRRDRAEVSSPVKHHRMQSGEQQADRAPLASAPKNQRGTFTRRPRNQSDLPGLDKPIVPQGTKNRKRGTKQVWMPVAVQVIEEGSSESAGKRQRTNSVFDRLEEVGEEQGRNRTASVFDRIEDPVADPAAQGRRGQ